MKERSAIRFVCGLTAIFAVACVGESRARLEPPLATDVPFTVTRGAGEVKADCPVALDCTGGGNVREVLCGEITDGEGRVWTLPGAVSDGAPAVDLFDECTGDGHNAAYETQLETQVIDPEGAEVTAYLFGDNYFELYANGQFVGRDKVAFTPFNSHVARVQVEYPVTYAALLVDWEGYLGVGLEDSRGGVHIGDGGFIAAFSDGARTDASWRCRAFYVAPLDDPGCIALGEGGNPDSSGCPSTDDALYCIANDPTATCRAAHFPLPEGWMKPDHDDSGWSPAATYAADDVTRSAAIRDYDDTLFEGAEFIWSKNLDLDNLVLCRATIEAPPGSEPPPPALPR